MILCPYNYIISLAGLAQLVERKTLNLVVEGSSPSVGVFLYPLKFNNILRKHC